MHPRTLEIVAACCAWEPPEGLVRFVVSVDPAEADVSVRLHACCMHQDATIGPGFPLELLDVALGQTAATLLHAVARRHEEAEKSANPHVQAAGDAFEAAVARFDPHRTRTEEPR